MKLVLKEKAAEDFLYWKRTDSHIFHRINKLLRNIQETPFTGLGKPEPLKYELSGYYSRRINATHRIVYTVEDDKIYVISLRYHYKK